MITEATATTPILCFYRVWSAYKDLGYADGAKMVHVASISGDTIRREFDLQMEIETGRGQKFFGIEFPSRWFLKKATLRDGSAVSLDVTLDGDILF